MEAATDFIKHTSDAKLKSEVTAASKIIRGVAATFRPILLATGAVGTTSGAPFTDSTHQCLTPDPEHGTSR